MLKYNYQSLKTSGVTILNCLKHRHPQRFSAFADHQLVLQDNIKLKMMQMLLLM